MGYVNVDMTVAPIQNYLAKVWVTGLVIMYERDPVQARIVAHQTLESWSLLRSWPLIEALLNATSTKDHPKEVVLMILNAARLAKFKVRGWRKLAFDAECAYGNKVN